MARRTTSRARRKTSRRRRTRRLKPVAYRLADLLAQVHPGNLHEAMDFGPPQGREAL